MRAVLIDPLDAHFYSTIIYFKNKDYSILLDKMFIQFTAIKNRSSIHNCEGENNILIEVPRHFFSGSFSIV